MHTNSQLAQLMTCEVVVLGLAQFGLPWWPFRNSAARCTDCTVPEPYIKHPSGLPANRRQHMCGKKKDAAMLNGCLKSLRRKEATHLFFWIGTLQQGQFVSSKLFTSGDAAASRSQSCQSRWSCCWTFHSWEIPKYTTSVCRE